MNHTANILGSVVASTLRNWRGTSASRTVTAPATAIKLYDREGCPDCRFVREALTELNLDADIIPCPEQGQRFTAELEAISGGSAVPFLVDADQDAQVGGAQAIVDYLFQQYRGKTSPKALRATSGHQLASKLATSIRHGAGLKARPSRQPEKPLTLYSFESSPYSRPVRELLCELELPYRLINLGKQQRSDMGPAKLRFTLKPYVPLPNTKRAVFFAEHGNVQVPYLVDPNTDTALFESKDILAYLRKTYAI
jgi:glutathione S-transferase